MRLSKFNELLTDEFGAAYAEVIKRDSVLTALGDITAIEAIKRGIDPRVVWMAICDQQGVPEARRHGLNKIPKK
ncbi:MAG: DUF3046 domain-containing protein [Microbacteriaceae bacterium]